MAKQRRLVFALFLICTTISFTGCEGLLDSCKVCRLNTYENGTVILSSNEAEYCNTDLISIQATSDQVIGSTTLKWECD